MISLRTSIARITFATSSNTRAATSASRAPLARITLMLESSRSPLRIFMPSLGIVPLACVTVERRLSGSELSRLTTSAATTLWLISVQSQRRSALYSSSSQSLCRYVCPALPPL